MLEKSCSFYSRRRVSPAKLTLKTTFAGAGYAGTEAVSPGLRFPALKNLAEDGGTLGCTNDDPSCSILLNH